MPVRVRAARHYQHPQAPIRRLADNAIPGIARSLHKTFRAEREQFPRDRAIEMIRAGHHEEVLSLLDNQHIREAMRRPLGLLGDVWTDGARLGARKINGAFTSRRRPVRYGRHADPRVFKSLDAYLERVAKDLTDLFEFDAFDGATVQLIQTYQEALLSSLSADQIGAVRAIIVGGVTGGESAEEIVDKIQRAINLTPAQAQAVENFQRALIEAEYYRAGNRALLSVAASAEIASAAAGEQELTDERIQQLTDDYADRQLAYRAQMIATTETTRAASLGLQSAYSQAADRGVFPIGAVTKRWQISLDEKTCPVCLSVVDQNPEGVGLDEDFDSIDGPIDAPPAHPNCRCSIEIVLDLSQVSEEATADLDFPVDEDVGKYDPAEPRDDHGRWTSGGAGGGGPIDSGGGNEGSAGAADTSGVGVHAHTEQAASGIKHEWAAKSGLDTLDKVMAGAHANQAELVEAASAIGREVGAEFKNPGVKSNMARIQEKIDAGRTPAQVTDIVRGGFMVDSPGKADEIVAKLGERFPVVDEGWKVTDDGYFDRKAYVRFGNGQMGEVQIWEPKMFDAKEGSGGGHRLYEEARSPKTPPEKLPALKAQMQSLYGGVVSNYGPAWKAVAGKSD